MQTVGERQYTRSMLGIGAFVAAVSVAAIGAALTEGSIGPLNAAVEGLSSSASGELGGLATWLPLGFAFAAGMVSAVNPCGFSMLAPYLSLFLGTEATGSDARTTGGLLLALKVGATVTLGFVLLFGLVGVTIGLGANVLVTAFPWIGLTVGVLLAAAGAWLLAGGKLYSATAQEIASRFGSSENASLKSYFLFGLSYGTASLSCTLPIFLAVVGGSIAVSGLPNALGQFVLYGLGMGSVILGLTLTMALFKAGLARRLRSVLPLVQPLGAAMMLLAGSYVIYYWLTLGGLGERIL